MKGRFSDQIRQAIDSSNLSRYAIAKTCGIDKGNLSRFMSGRGGLSLEALDRIAVLVGMTVTLTPKKEASHGKRD